ncbi:MAG: hypothetical protein ABI624_18355 [Casimicrobiaceae bacterium]
MRLTIIRIKPNPAGKDRPAHGGPSAAQLAGEWVDFRNDAGQDMALNGISLWHLAYTPGRQATWEKVTDFTGTLPAGKIVRVHGGETRALSVIRPEDLAGADYHAFSGRDAYVWNNKQGDSPLLYVESTKQTIDQTSYAPNPPEGAVLVRQGDQLVTAVARAANW